MQIVNESDMHLTWWCYNAEDEVREVTVDWGKGKGDLAPGGRVSYNPPSNATGRYYVQFTLRDGSLPYSWWKAANQWTFARCPSVRGDETLIYRGSNSFEAIVT
jgi:hypothetical protein